MMYVSWMELNKSQCILQQREVVQSQIAKQMGLNSKRRYPDALELPRTPLRGWQIEVMTSDCSQVVVHASVVTESD